MSLIALSRLGPRQAAALATQVAADQSVPAGMLERIAAQTDGVPLFIEELTKTVIERGGLANATASALPVPSTLQGLLLARLDRLPAAKQVAQIGSVIGREFGHELITQGAALPDGALGRGLDDLVGAGLAFRRGVPPNATFVFKHALVQDAAYASLLRGTRQELHARIARVLEVRFHEVCERQPELLARHFTQADLTEPAIDYWRRAGERATERSANVEAVAHSSQGLKLTAALPDMPHRAEEELALQMAKSAPLIATKGHSALEVEQTYLRAKELSEQLGRSTELFPVLHGLSTCYLVRGELMRAHTLAEQLVALADEQKAEPLCRALACRVGFHNVLPWSVS